MRRLHLPVRLAFLAAVLLTVLAVAVTIPVLDAHRRWVLEAFTHRGAAYATTFVDSVEAWIVGGRGEMVETATRLLAVAGVSYVRVVHDGRVIAEEGTVPASAAAVDVTGGGPSEPRTSFVRSPEEPTILDQIVPFRGLWDSTLRGYVHLGIDARSATGSIRSAGWLAAGLAVGFLALVWSAALAFVFRARAPRPRAHDAPPSPSGGRLVVDERRKTVTCDGVPVSLTPKQFALLRLLASDRRRVFSDREILAAVWPESHYADAKDVKQCVYLIRKRFAESGVPVTGLLVNVPGFGYRIEDAPEHDPDVT
ncbi:MAG: winged helix-turn-helix transcriptional regulator [Candidatus Bipolaricaulota bacterium]|nr:MAG: winged helix-turn-helix transcriptional regulator [Candidatus Bipolaricaulota bacterium]